MPRLPARLPALLPALLLPVLLLLAAPPAAWAGQGNDRRTTTAETDFGRAFPVSFRSERGGRFQPDRLVVLTRTGSWSAALPAKARRVRQADHLDLTGLPVIGGVFRPRLAPMDAERQGLPLGTVTRTGDTLVLDARGHAVSLTNLPVVLTSEMPRVGTLSFELGTPAFRPGPAPGAAGARVGAAWLVDGRLVLAGDGQRPPLRF